MIEVSLYIETGAARARSFLPEALVGFQGRGCADGVPPDFCHALLLEVLIFQWP